MLSVLTLEEVADYLRVHPSTIYRLVKKHQIPAFKIGSDWRFNRESIDTWRVQSETGSNGFLTAVESEAKPKSPRTWPPTAKKKRSEQLA